VQSLKPTEQSATYRSMSCCDPNFISSTNGHRQHYL
jgi:hypothetical protein